MSNVLGFREYKDPDFSDFEDWRSEDIKLFDKLSDFDNLKTDHNYAITETESGGLYTYTTVITDDGGAEIARKVVAEESATSTLTTVTIGDDVSRYRVTETVTGYNREAVE